MNRRDTPRRKRPEDWTKKRAMYSGVGTLLRFDDVDGIIVAKSMADLEKLSRGYYLANFEKKLAKKCTVRRK